MDLKLRLVDYDFDPEHIDGTSNRADFWTRLGVEVRDGVVALTGRRKYEYSSSDRVATEKSYAR